MSTPDATTDSQDPVVAIQIGAVSFADEGVEPVLDILQERGAVNALFLATPTWTRGTGGRQVPGRPLPDHGVQSYDHDWVGGNYATIHPEFYRTTRLGPVGRAPDYDGDLLSDVVSTAAERGVASYAWMEESSYAQALRDYPNFPQCLEVDVWGRPAPRPCFNNPDYRNWHLGIVEDYVKSYPIDGLAWCSERPGPLNILLQRSNTPPELVTCFCRYCRDRGQEAGIDVDRARAGYRELLDWNSRVGAGDRPADGAFVTFWRILLHYPEILAWQTLWTQSQRQLYRDIYGVAKACRRSVQVGWHVFHEISFSPFYRADQDYAELSELSDFIKVVEYNNCAGPRFHSWIDSISHSLFGDADPEQVYPLMLRLLGLEEADYGDLPQTGFSADYVRRETARAVAGVRPGCKILPGIDIDIPVGQVPAATQDRRRRSEAPSGVNADNTSGSALTHCTPEGVRDAVLAAFDGGADGVVLSRKYSEMRLDNLSGAGEAIRQLANQRTP
ncbi:glycoside hydrolase family 10 protein [Microlunatus soli]|uniref:Uncharacterized protein n=1 Tax=Microlunatus soli TaxID=630515 RepID=A0A1H1XSZ4_9ACTN|nr:hypothetical protein [Microlunatus soli]SDT12378.1 hypothetical protein SAMN04489812_4228 [Microlunatus soli]